MHEMGPREPTTGNTQLTRQNDILFTEMELVYCLTRKTLKCNSLVQKICMFLQKETSYCKSSFALSPGPWGPKHYIFGDRFYFENARKLRFHVVLLFHARKHVISSFYLKWTEFTRYCEFCSNCESPWTRTKLVKTHNLLWIRSTLGNIICFLALKGRNTWNLSFLGFFE